MRKLLLGIGLLAVNRVLSRGKPAGWRGLVSPGGLIGTVIAAAATELLAHRRKAPPPQTA